MTAGVPLELVCLDLAGTTVADEGLVEAAFDQALEAVGVADDDPRRPAMAATVRDTMGMAKLEVFTLLLGEGGAAGRANEAFEQAYGRLVAAGAARPIDGAAEAVVRLQQAGLRVAFTTGFSPRTRQALLRSLGWEQLADLALSPADAGRGRPHPDMVLTALLRLQVSEVAAVAVAGDTASDMVAGRRAGASVVAGVLTGSDDRQRLTEAGATHVLGSVAELPDLLGR